MLSVACALWSGHFVGLSHRPRAERPWSYSLGLALSLAQLAIFALAGAREHKLPGFARNMPLGAGFFAAVYLGHMSDGTRAALKFCAAEAIKDMLREADTLARVARLGLLIRA